MKIDRVVLMIAAFAISTAMTLASDWNPPDNPDPQTILNEAQADMRAKRYEIALTKHVWFHENALKINQAMTGVRLSFALTYWKNLGQEYPPAMDKLRQIRDELEAKANEGKDIGNGFSDLASINETLEEESKTTDAFKILVSKNPEAAKKAFLFAKSALIKDKEYALYVKYVDAKRDYLQMKHMYEMNTQMAEDLKFGARMSDHAIKSFRNHSATLIAILSANDRKREASEIATLAKKELEDTKFHEELEAALAGIVPSPWP